jgi:hypothetical protein
VAQCRVDAVDPITVLAKLPASSTPAASPPRTRARQIDLDLSLLDSSPPNGTELRQASALLITPIQACRDLPSPAKRFTQRMTRVLEVANSENVTLRKQVKEQAELLHTRKARKRGKRVALKGRSVFSTQVVLEIARSAKLETSSRKTIAKPKKRRLIKDSDEEVEQDLPLASDDSGSDRIVISMLG